MRTPLPSTLAIGYYLAIALAVLLGCCATYSGASVVFQSVMLRNVQHDVANDPATDPAASRMMRAQPTIMAITSGDVIFGLLTTLALGFGGGLGLSGRRSGRTAALIAFAMVGLGALIDVGIAIWSWRLMAGLMDPSTAQAIWIASLIGLIPSGLWMLLRLALTGVATRSVLSEEASAYYARIDSDGRRPVRE